MIKLVIKCIFVTVALLTLAACGGGGGTISGSSTPDGNVPSTPDGNVPSTPEETVPETPSQSATLAIELISMRHALRVTAAVATTILHPLM